MDKTLIEPIAPVRPNPEEENKKLEALNKFIDSCDTILSETGEVPNYGFKTLDHSKIILEQNILSDDLALMILQQLKGNTINVQKAAIEKALAAVILRIESMIKENKRVILNRQYDNENLEELAINSTVGDIVAFVRNSSTSNVAI